MNTVKKNLYTAAAVMILTFCLFYAHQGYFFIDISRELYLPQAMDAGGVLYKDIFNAYAPLGWQVNSFLPHIFNGGLIVFYAAGLINAFLILAALYLISRMFLSDKTSEILCFFTISACIFSNTAANYIFPYSYSMVYALNAFLWALYMLLKYAEQQGAESSLENKKYLYLSFAAFGASIAFKYEFFLFVFVLAYFFFKKTSFKEKLLCAASFFAAPALSFAALIIQGAGIKDFLEAFNYAVLLSKAQSVKHLYAYLGFIPSIEFAKILFKHFLCAVSAAFFAAIPFFMQEKKNRMLMFAVRYMCFAAAAFIIYANRVFLFSWAGLFCFVLAAVLLIRRKKQENKLYLILIISSVLASAKTIFNISFNTYGNYFMPLLIICLAVCVFQCIKEEQKKSAEKCINLFLCIMTCIYLCTNYFGALKYHDAPLITKKGILYTQAQYAQTINAVIDYIEKNTKKDYRVLVLPDGAIINYFTDRKSDNKYYSLTPPNVEIFTQEKIIEHLKNNMPEYVIIHPIIYGDYGRLSFCRDYGAEICRFIESTYEKEKYIIDEKSKFWMQIYKKNNI